MVWAKPASPSWSSGSQLTGYWQVVSTKNPGLSPQLTPLAGSSMGGVVPEAATVKTAVYALKQANITIPKFLREQLQTRREAPDACTPQTEVPVCPPSN